MCAIRYLDSFITEILSNLYPSSIVCFQQKRPAAVALECSKSTTIFVISNFVSEMLRVTSTNSEVESAIHWTFSVVIERLMVFSTTHKQRMNGKLCLS